MKPWMLSKKQQKNAKLIYSRQKQSNSLVLLSNNQAPTCKAVKIENTFKNSKKLKDKVEIYILIIFKLKNT